MKCAPVLSYGIIKAPSKHSNRANEGNGHLTKIHVKYFQLAFKLSSLFIIFTKNKGNSGKSKVHVVNASTCTYFGLNVPPKSIPSGSLLC